MEKLNQDSKARGADTSTGLCNYQIHSEWSQQHEKNSAVSAVNTSQHTDTTEDDSLSLLWNNAAWDTWQHQQRQFHWSTFFLSTDETDATLTLSCFPSSSLIRTRHSLSRASHVHTNTFAGYHTATLFLLNRRSLFSDLEHKGSGQRLRKNQARPPRLLSKKK